MFCRKKCTAKFGIFVILLLAVNCVLFYGIYYELPKILYDRANAVEEGSDESFRGSSELPESETQSSTETIYSTESVSEDYEDYSTSSEPPYSTKRPSLSEFETG